MHSVAVYLDKVGIVNRLLLYLFTRTLNVALCSNASALDRKFEGSILAANSICASFCLYLEG